MTKEGRLVDVRTVGFRHSGAYFRGWSMSYLNITQWLGRQSPKRDIYQPLYSSSICTTILLQLTESGNQSCATVATRRTCTMLGVLGGLAWGGAIKFASTCADYLAVSGTQFCGHSVLKYECQNTTVRASKYDFDITTLKVQIATSQFQSQISKYCLEMS